MGVLGGDASAGAHGYCERSGLCQHGGEQAGQPPTDRLSDAGGRRQYCPDTARPAAAAEQQPLYCGDSNGDEAVKNRRHSRRFFTLTEQLVRVDDPLFS